MDKNMETPTQKDLNRSIRRKLLWGGAIALALVGGVGGWASQTDIAGAVTAQGSVAVESKVKQVQHQEGGIPLELRSVARL